jgi:hypothetical protein
MRAPAEISAEKLMSPGSSSRSGVEQVCDSSEETTAAPAAHAIVNSDYKYWAFINYSDEQRAQCLHMESES